MRYIAVDIETTGLSPIKDKIIEIGAVKYENGTAIASFSSLVHAQIISLPERIIELTGITDEMLQDAPTEREVMTQFLEFATEDFPLLGHNIPFDYSFLKVASLSMGIPFERNGIDTLKLARVCCPEMSSKTLSAMCEKYDIHNEQAHRAYEDAIATVTLYEKLKQDYEETNPSIFQPQPLVYKEKKQEPVTPKQIRYLEAIIAYHKLELKPAYEQMTKSEVARLIDTLLNQYGRIPYIR